MLNTQDKKWILNTIKTNIQVLLKEIVELFDVTNKRIDHVNETLSQRVDESNERIDKVLAKLKDHNDILDNHERRIEKVEEKVFTTTIA